METILIIILVGVLALIAGIFIGMWIGIDYTMEDNSEELYCFQCEIETPVKVKNGKMHCENCGLRH